jgi:hypothetical protein
MPRFSLPAPSHRAIGRISPRNGQPSGLLRTLAILAAVAERPPKAAGRFNALTHSSPTGNAVPPPGRSATVRGLPGVSTPCANPLRMGTQFPSRSQRDRSKVAGRFNARYPALHSVPVAERRSKSGLAAPPTGQPGDFLPEYRQRSRTWVGCPCPGLEDRATRGAYGWKWGVQTGMQGQVPAGKPVHGVPVSICRRGPFKPAFPGLFECPRSALIMAMRNAG